MNTRELISAGGVAFRNVGSELEIVLIKTASEGRWQLPKGIIDPGETPGIAALREARKEAGIDCELLLPLDVINYWFVDRYSSEAVKIHKFVHYFLMSYISGDVNDHDDEVFEARWVHSSEAARMLSFDTERTVVELALREMK